MKQITDKIYIGGRSDIFISAEIVDNKTNVEVIPQNKAFKFPFIKSYLNVAKDLNINGIELPKVGLIDGKGNNKDALMSAINIMDKLIKQHGNVMVFCQKGESRSALVVLAYLYFKKSIHIAKAYDLIRFAKSDIKINPFLSLMLCELSGEKYFELADNKDTIPLKVGQLVDVVAPTSLPTPKVKPKSNGQSTKKRGRSAQKK